MRQAVSKIRRKLKCKTYNKCRSTTNGSFFAEELNVS